MTTKLWDAVLDVIKRAEDGVTTSQIIDALEIGAGAEDHAVHPVRRALRGLDVSGTIYPVQPDGAEEATWYETPPRVEPARVVP